MRKRRILFILIIGLYCYRCTGADNGRENVQSYLNTLAPMAINYSSAALVFSQNVAVVNGTPSITTKLSVSACVIAPPLPAGLVFDQVTCAITGTPIATQSATAYHVTASNVIGSVSTDITISVNAATISSCQSNASDAAPSSLKCVNGLAYTNESGAVDATLTFTLRLSAMPSATVTLTMASSDTTEARLASSAGACNNASATSQASCTLTFTAANWNIDQTVKIIAYNDFMGNETPTPIYNITLTGTSADAAYNGLSATAFANITSNQMPNRLTFVTTNTNNGNLGGVAGADAFCMNDPGHPDAALALASRRTFKAFITTTGGTIRQYDSPLGRGFPGQINWVMLPNTTYYRSDQTTIIATTNAAANFSSMNNSVDGTANESWLGFLPGNTWTAYIMGCGAPCPLFTGNCNNFTDGTSATSLRTLIQNTNMPGNLFSSGAVRTCDVARRLWCIQQ